MNNVQGKSLDYLNRTQNYLNTKMEKQVKENKVTVEHVTFLHGSCSQTPTAK